MASFAACLFGFSAQAQDWVEPTASYPGYGGVLYLTWPSGYNVSVTEDAAGYVTRESTGEVFECLYYYWDLFPNGNSLEFTIRKSNIVEGDTYVITLAADQYSLTYNGQAVESQDINVTWTYGSSDTPTEPSEVAYTSSYDEGTVKYYITSGTPTINEGAEAILTRNGEEVATYALSDSDINIDYNQRCYVIPVNLTPEDIEADGKYVLTVPSTAYTAYTYDSSTYDEIDLVTVDLVCEFQVGEVIEEPEDPNWVEPEVSVYYGMCLVLYWPSDYKASATSSSSVGYVTVHSTGEVIECSYSDYTLFPYYNELDFDIEDVVAGETYTISIEASQYALTYNGEAVATKDINITWTYEVTPREPEDVVYTSSYNAGTVDFNITNGTPTIEDGQDAILTRDGEVVAYYTLYDDVNCVTNWDTWNYMLEVVIPDADIEAAGNYALTIPSTAYTAYAYDYDTYEAYDLVTVDLVCEFTVSGSSALQSIEAEAQSFTVYTTSGVCVLRNANADQVKALPKGLYIVNGKKVAITK